MQKLPTIVIKTIPHKEQRYPTVGDYWRDMLGRVQLRVSRMGADEEFLVAIHELIEWYLVERKGISIESIDAFDKAYEGDDPGADPQAPYHKEHMKAEEIERILADYLDIDWAKYDELVRAL